MLTEERYGYIMDEIERNSVVYVSELVKALDTSESTIRRDLNFLHKEGKINKVHGGATSIEGFSNIADDVISVREEQNKEEKLKIAQYAASLVKANDFVYMDAGTTTILMVRYLKEKNATYITNGINNAKELIKNGFNTYLIGGELKGTTEAVIGSEAINNLKKYNFTKGFFGTNGISKSRGLTTPDIKEALVKQEALNRARKSYILADKTKFDEVSPVTFGALEDVVIITTKVEDNKYKEIAEIVEVID